MLSLETPIYRTSIFTLATCLLCLGLFSCGYAKHDAEKYLPGEYFYETPIGDFHVLVVNRDFSFKQFVYSKDLKLEHKNEGKMHVDGDGIEFENWLECYDPSDQTKILTPFLTYSMGHYWRKPEGKEGVLIIMFDDTDYIFRKQKDTKSHQIQ